MYELMEPTEKVPMAKVVKCEQQNKYSSIGL